MNRSPEQRPSRLILLISLLAVVLAAASPAADWPQWRGPNRDGKSGEVGLLKQWPPEGPKLAWKALALGKGYSSVSQVGQRLFTIADRDGASFVIALSSLNGKLFLRDQDVLLCYEVRWSQITHQTN